MAGLVEAELSKHSVHTPTWSNPVTQGIQQPGKAVEFRLVLDTRLPGKRHPEVRRPAVPIEGRKEILPAASRNLQWQLQEAV